jgi:RNA-binding protein YhbY
MHAEIKLNNLNVSKHVIEQCKNRVKNEEILDRILVTIRDSFDDSKLKNICHKIYQTWKNDKVHNEGKALLIFRDYPIYVKVPIKVNLIKYLNKKYYYDIYLTTFMNLGKYEYDRKELLDDHIKMAIKNDMFIEKNEENLYILEDKFY